MAEPGFISPLLHALEDTRKPNYVFQLFRENRFKGDLTKSIELTIHN